MYFNVTYVTVVFSRSDVSVIYSVAVHLRL